MDDLDRKEWDERIKKYDQLIIIRTVKKGHYIFNDAGVEYGYADTSFSKIISIFEDKNFTKSIDVVNNLLEKYQIQYPDDRVSVHIRRYDQKWFGEESMENIITNELNKFDYYIKDGEMFLN